MDRLVWYILDLLKKNYVSWQISRNKKKKIPNKKGNSERESAEEKIGHKKTEPLFPKFSSYPGHRYGCNITDIEVPRSKFRKKSFQVAE